MKKTLRLVGVAAMVLLLAASCKKEEKNNGETRKVTFTAGIEQGGGAKTGLTNGQDPHAFNQVWTEGDNIRINGHNFVLEKGKETASGTFTGEVALSDQGPYYAFYPAPEETQQRGDQDFSKVTFEIPPTQVYTKNSYATNLAPMASYSESQQLTFTNLCGLMELGLKGENITVTSLELSCDKPICGQTKEYTIGGDADLEMAEGAGEPITMDCGEGVTLDGTTSFIFVLPPVDKGKFSLKVNYKKGVESNVFVETIDLTSMNISINASQVSYNNTAYEIGNVSTKEVSESGATVLATTATILYTVDNMAGYNMSESGVCYGVNENPDLTGSHQTGSRASSYTASLSGLSPNTHYYARAYAKYSPASKDGSDVVVYGNQIEFTTLSIGGTVTTDDVSSITATGASLGYSVAPNTGSQATQHGICYSTSEHPVYTDNPVSGTDQSPYTVPVSSLTPNTTYYYRAYAIFAVASKDEPEVVYGEEKSFTTQSIGGTVTTGNVSSITATGASVAYTVTPNAYSKATQHGVCYSTSQNPVATGSHVEGPDSSPYSVSLTGLNASTKYYVRAYAIFAVASKDEPEVVYGEEKSFTTQSIGGTVTTGNVSSITATGASVAYTFAPNGYSRATQHGVCYSTDQNPVASGSHVEGPDSSPYSVSLTYLNASTTYYVRAYAVFGPASKDGNSVTVYGEQTSFKTSSSVPEGFVDFGTHVGGGSTGKPLYWAKWNLGARENHPEDVGNYYAWGEIDGTKTDFNWGERNQTNGYKYGYNDKVFKYCNSSTQYFDNYLYSSPDSKKVLDNDDDAAYQTNHDNRMPTREEWQALTNAGYFVYVNNYNSTNVKGVIVFVPRQPEDAGKTYNSGTIPSGYSLGDDHIFLPIGGRKIYNNQPDWTTAVVIWTKSVYNEPGDNDVRYARCFYLTNSLNKDYFVYYAGRNTGLNIRPVREGD